MPKSATPSGPKSAGDNRNLVPVDETYAAPGLEDKLHLFWEKNSRTVVAVIVAVALAVIGRGVYGVYVEKHEQGIAADYAAATTDAQLKAFAAGHAGHPLAGLAQLRLADSAYATGDYAAARNAYEQALPLLAGTPFAPRAQLGAGVAALQANQPAEATTALTRLINDTTQPKAVRAEAAYNLAAQAAAAGHADEASRLTGQILTIDPTGPFVERALTLQARSPAATGPGPAITPPALVPAPPPPSKTDAPPSVEFKLPNP